MINFKIHKPSSKKWNKRFPRAKINNKGGDRKAAKVSNWFKENWIDDYYYCLPKWRLLDRFLKANIGKPVDEVFSKFVKRCDKSMHTNGIKEFFNSAFYGEQYSHCKNRFYIIDGKIFYKEKKK